MIPTWYFCVATQTPPQATQAFMSMIDALGPSPDGGDGDAGLVREALRQLAKTQPWMRRYAIPHVMTAALRFRNDPEVAAEAATILEESLAIIYGPIAQGLRGAWQAILTGEPTSDLRTLLAAGVSSIRLRDPGAVGRHPYGDVEQFVPELFAIALCLNAVRHDPALGQDLHAEDDLNWLFTKSRKNSFGRLPRLLAIELGLTVGKDLINPGELVRGLQHPYLGSVGFEPDLLSLYARAKFGIPGHRSQPVDAVARIVTEIVALQHIPQQPKPNLNGEALTRMGLGGRPTNAAATMLWQAVLWELAVATNPAEAAEAADDWWVAPSTIRSTLRTTVPVPQTRLAKWYDRVGRRYSMHRAEPLNLAVKPGRVHPSPWLATALTSPWLTRKDDRSRLKADQGTAFEQGEDALLLFYLFVSCALGTSLLRSSGSADRRSLVLLLMHTADVLDDPVHRRYISDLSHPRNSNEPASMPSAIAGLGLYAKRLVDRAGAGHLDDLNPKCFVDALLKRATHAQERQLTKEAGFQIVVTWALNGLAGSTPEGDGQRTNPWRTDGSAPTTAGKGLSLAEYVFQTAADRLHPAMAARPAALLRAYFGSDSHVTSVAWNDSGRQPQKVTNQWTVLGGKPLTIDDWSRYPRLHNNRSLPLLALHTERLLCSFDQAAGVSDGDRWMREWDNVLGGIASTIQFPRYIRLLLLRLFDSTVDRTAEQRQVLENILDTEIELGLGTPLDRWVLFDKLGSGTAKKTELVQTLRVRLLRGLYRQQSVDSPSPHAYDPSAAMANLRSDRLLGQLLQRFILECGNEHVHLAGKLLNSFVPQLWVEAHQPPRIKSLNIRPDERADADFRLLTGITIDSLTGNLQTHFCPSPVSVTTAGAKVHDPHASGDWPQLNPAGDLTWVAGIVTATDSETAWVNNGRTEPTPVTPAEGRQVGDIVAVPLVSSNRAPHFAVCGSAEPLAQAPVVGDITTATVTASPGSGPARRLRVAVAGSSSFDPAGLTVSKHRLWEPDLVASFTDTAPDERQVHVRWDGESWLPLGWRFTEFLALESDGIREDGETRLVLISDRDQHGYMRFATSSGHNLVLLDDDWSDPEALLAEIRRVNGDPSGLKVRVRVDVHGSGRPRLALVQDSGSAFDDRVVRWRQVFEEAESYEAYRDEDGRWRLYTDLAGMPPIEVKLPGIAGPTICQFQPGPTSWDDAEQRSARVSGKLVESSRLEIGPHPNRTDYERVTSIKDGNTVVLARVSKVNKQGFVHGYTDRNLPIRVAAESLSFEVFDSAASLPRHLKTNRPVRITHVSNPRWQSKTAATQLSGDELVMRVHPGQRDIATTRLAGLTVLRGILVAAPYGVHDNDAVFTVWLDLGNEIVACSLRRENFSGDSWVGGIVRGRKQAGYWSFNIAGRTIRATALWNVRDGSPKAGFELGTTYWDGRPHTLRQSMVGPDLYLDDLTGGDFTEHPANERTLGSPRAVGDGVIEPWNVQGNRRRITVRFDRGTLSGETHQLQPSITDRVRYTEVKLELVDTNIVSVRRVFLLSSRDNEGPAEDDLSEFRRYLSGGRGVLSGRITADNSVQLDTGWRVPVNGRPTHTVPLVPGEQSWVQPPTEVPYSSYARIILIGDDENCTASYRQVAPMSLSEFWKLLRQQGATMNRFCEPGERIYYAARETADNQGAHRFEWGYGKTVVIPEACLTIGDRRAEHWPVTPFHGDRVKMLRVVRDTRVPGGLRLDISPQHLQFDLMTRAYREAREGVVHPAEIETIGGNPRIVALHTRALAPSDDERHQDSESVSTVRAKLSPEAVETLNELRKTLSPESPEPRPGTRKALVKLREKPFEESAGSTAEFDIIEPAQLKAGMRTFMEAGEIIQKGNEVLLELKLADLIGRKDPRRQVTWVLSRGFSRRKNLLKQILQYAPNRHEQLAGSVYLVQLGDPRRGGQAPKLHGGPGRPKAQLRSRARNDASVCFAYVRRMSRRFELEVRPNVSFYLDRDDVHNAKAVPDSALVRVVSRDNGRFSLQPVLIGDNEYLPSVGRPAVVLPMHDLLSRHDSLDKAIRKGHFTVAGLPSIMVSAYDSAADARSLLRTRHPKTAIVARQKDWTPVLRLPDNPLNAAWLYVDLHGAAWLRHGNAAGFRIKWSQLSFMDVGAKRIHELCEQRGWDYHDVETSHRSRHRHDRVEDPVALPSPARITCDIAFFDERWSLRYNAKDLNRFGYPATDLVDGETGRRIDTEETDFAVAGVAYRRGHASGVWIEQAPGRVVELPGDALAVATGDNRHLTLENLDWEHLSPGDRLTVSIRRTSATDIAGLRLHRWDPGPRGSFGTRALLPVSDVNTADLSIRLGHGVWALEYPLEPDMPPPKVGQPVWLDADNTIEAPTGSNPELSTGDVVMLVLNPDGEFGILGAPGYAVELGVQDGDWPQWLRAALADPVQTVALEEMCGCLPVMVTRRTPGTVTVSRRHIRDDSLSPASIVPAVPLGMLDANRVVLRRGSRLSICVANELVPGLPPESLPQALDALQRARRPLWITADERGGGFSVGLRPGGVRPQQEVRIRPIAVLQTAGGSGVLCWQPDKHRPRWLPGTEIGWTEITAEDLRRHIVKRYSDGNMEVRICSDGTVSITQTARNFQRFKHLELGDPVPVVAVGDTAHPEPGDRVRFLARIHLSDILVDFRTGDTDPPLDSSPTMCEVDRKSTKDSNYLSVCAMGKRRFAMDIPKWMDSGDPETYTDWGGIRGSLDMTKPHHEVMSLALEKPPPSAELHYDAAVRWLKEHGRAAFGLDEDSVLDAAPALAAVVVIAAAARADVPVADLISRTAVHLCRQIGLRAARSRHLDPLSNEWLTPADPNRGMLWDRLDAAKLLHSIVSADDLNELKRIDRGLQARTALRADHDLQVVSSSLAATLGLQRDFDGIHGYTAGVLANLTNLGRSLTPPKGQFVAQNRLISSQIDYISDNLHKILASGPTILLAVPPNLQDLEYQRGEDLLQEWSPLTC